MNLHLALARIPRFCPPCYLLGIVSTSIQIPSFFQCRQTIMLHSSSRPAPPPRLAASTIFRYYYSRETYNPPCHPPNPLIHSACTLVMRSKFSRSARLAESCASCAWRCDCAVVSFSGSGCEIVESKAYRNRLRRQRRNTQVGAVLYCSAQCSDGCSLVGRTL